MKNKLKLFINSKTILYISLLFIISLYSLIDFYFVKASEKKYAHVRLDNIAKNTIKQLQEDFLKISTYLDVCNYTKCNYEYKPTFSLLPAFILLKKKQLEKELKIELFTESNVEFISLSQGTYKIVIKTEAIKNKINSIMPSYVQYSIHKKDLSLINNGSNRDREGEFKELFRSFNLLHDKLFIDYWINDEYIQSRITSLKENIVNAFCILAIAMILISILLFRYIKYTLYADLTLALKKANNQKNKLEERSFNEKQKVSLLEKVHTLDRKITKMFFRYLLSKNESEIKSDQPLYELKLREKIIIKDSQNSHIDIGVLIQELQTYFAEYVKFNNIDFQSHTDIDGIELRLAKESFYQIVFSLVDNKLRLLGRGDKLKLSFIYDKNKLICLLKDSGFLLSEEQVKEYARKITERSNLFFLSWDEIMSVLKDSGYHYEVNVTDNINTIQITFLSSIHYANENKVCYLDHYRK